MSKIIRKKDELYKDFFDVITKTNLLSKYISKNKNSFYGISNTDEMIRIEKIEEEISTLKDRAEELLLGTNLMDFLDEDKKTMTSNEMLEKYKMSKEEFDDYSSKKFNGFIFEYF